MTWPSAARLHLHGDGGLHAFGSHPTGATLKRFNQLIDDALCDPAAGIGKPGPLRHILAGAWSRRIGEEHRLVYLVDGEELVIAAPPVPGACRYQHRAAAVVVTRPVAMSST